jgi:hypothetical protein
VTAPRIRESVFVHSVSEYGIYNQHREFAVGKTCTPSVTKLHSHKGTVIEIIGFTGIYCWHADCLNLSGLVWFEAGNWRLQHTIDP